MNLFRTFLFVSGLICSLAFADGPLKSLDQKYKNFPKLIELLITNLNDATVASKDFTFAVKNKSAIALRDEIFADVYYDTVFNGKEYRDALLRLKEQGFVEISLKEKSKNQAKFSVKVDFSSGEEWPKQMDIGNIKDIKSLTFGFELTQYFESLSSKKHKCLKEVDVSLLGSIELLCSSRSDSTTDWNDCILHPKRGIRATEVRIKRLPPPPCHRGNSSSAGGRG